MLSSLSVTRLTLVTRPTPKYSTTLKKTRFLLGASVSFRKGVSSVVYTLDVVNSKSYVGDRKI